MLVQNMEKKKSYVNKIKYFNNIAENETLKYIVKLKE